MDARFQKSSLSYSSSPLLSLSSPSFGQALRSLLQNRRGRSVGGSDEEKVGLDAQYRLGWHIVLSRCLALPYHVPASRSLDGRKRLWHLDSGDRATRSDQVWDPIPPNFLVFRGLGRWVIISPV